MRLFGSQGLVLNLQGAPSNEISLAAGQCVYFNSYPNPSVPGRGTGNAGWMTGKLGRYSAIQQKDPISGIWRGIGDDGNNFKFQYSDGANIRIANQSGCAVAAVVTTAGSGYVTAPTVVPSAGSSVWQAVLGPLVSAITVSYGGTNYTYPPVVVIDAPPAGGVQATAYATLTSGAVSAVTMLNEGAGYNGGTPNVTLVPDIRDTTGSGAVTVATTSGSGTVAAVLCTDHGNPITSGTVPTLTFGSGSAAATVLMNWGITTYSVSTAGAGYTSAAAMALVTAAGPNAVSGAAYTNPDIQQSLVRVRNANLWVPTNSTGGLLVGGLIVDGGIYAGIPTPVITAAQPPSTTGVLAFTMGGFNDTSYIQPS